MIKLDCKIIQYSFLLTKRNSEINKTVKYTQKMIFAEAKRPNIRESDSFKFK